MPAVEDNFEEHPDAQLTVSERIQKTAAMIPDSIPGAKMTIIRIDDPSIFVGKDLDAAFGTAADHGYTALHVNADKIAKEFVKDYDPLRVLLTTVKGIVTAAKIG